jgi:hypothetical protein
MDTQLVELIGSTIMLAIWLRASLWALPSARCSRPESGLVRDARDPARLERRPRVLSHQGSSPAVRRRGERPGLGL